MRSPLLDGTCRPGPQAWRSGGQRPGGRPPDHGERDSGGFERLALVQLVADERSLSCVGAPGEGRSEGSLLGPPGAAAAGSGLEEQRKCPLCFAFRDLSWALWASMC